jgi:hypothetical protein
MTLLTVPVIDIGPFRGDDLDAQLRVAAADEACRQIGFLVIGGHGISPALVAETEAVSRQFFDLDLAENMLVRRPSPDVTRGYIPVLAESVARSRGAAAPGRHQRVDDDRPDRRPANAVRPRAAGGQAFRAESVAGPARRAPAGVDGLLPCHGDARRGVDADLRRRPPPPRSRFLSRQDRSSHHACACAAQRHTRPSRSCEPAPTPTTAA